MWGGVCGGPVGKSTRAGTYLRNCITQRIVSAPERRGGEIRAGELHKEKRRNQASWGRLEIADRFRLTPKETDDFDGSDYYGFSVISNKMRGDGNLNLRKN